MYFWENVIHHIIIKFANFLLICIKIDHNQFIFLWLKLRLKIQ